MIYPTDKAWEKRKKHLQEIRTHCHKFKDKYFCKKCIYNQECLQACKLLGYEPVPKLWTTQDIEDIIYGEKLRATL